MQRARTAWRVLNNGAWGGGEPVALMLPKLVRQGPPSRACQSSASERTQAAAARLEQAEGAARAAVLHAATVASMAGVPYQPPDGMLSDLGPIGTVRRWGSGRAPGTEFASNGVHAGMCV